MFWQRHPKATKTVWWSSHMALANEFKKLLDQDDSSDRFGPEYLLAVAERKDMLERRQWKLSLFNLLLLTALFIHLISKVNQFSLLGISSNDIGDLKELIVAVSATVTLINGFFALAIGHTKVVIKTWLEKNYEDKNARLFAALKLPGFFGEFALIFDTNDGAITPQGLTGILTIGGLLLGLGLLLAVSLGVPIVHGYIVWDIYKSSVLPSPWPTVLICYIIAANITYVAYAFGPKIRLPFKDRSLSMELTRIKEEQGEEAYNKRLKEIVFEFNARKKG